MIEDLSKTIYIFFPKIEKIGLLCDIMEKNEIIDAVYMFFEI